MRGSADCRPDPRQVVPPVVIRDAARYRTYREGFLKNDSVSYGFSNRALAESTADTFAPSGPVLSCWRGNTIRFARSTTSRASQPVFHWRVEELDSAHIMSQQSPVNLARRILIFRDEVI